MIKTSIQNNVKNKKLFNAIQKALNYDLKKVKNLKSKGYIDYKNKIIYIKSDLDLKLANFVIKHELAHAILYEYKIAQYMSQKNREYWADLLAYKILLTETNNQSYFKYVRDKIDVKPITSVDFEKIVEMIKYYFVTNEEEFNEILFDSYKTYGTQTPIINVVQGTAKVLGIGVKIIIAAAEKAVQKAAGIKR